MPDLPTLQEQMASAGIAYGRRHDISYRLGFVLQVLGAAALAVLYPMGSPFYTVGVMVFELGVLLSGIYLLVWISWIKKIVLGSVLIGIPLQVFGSLYAPEQYAGSIIIAGIGLVCVGAAGMAGKEAYCFGWREGWVLMWSFPAIVIVNLVLRENHLLNSLAFSAIFLMLLSLVGKKVRQPLLEKCMSDQQTTDGQTTDYKP
jgi:uncharacterized integral membrane protein